MMDYPCGEFGDCSFSRFGSLVRTNRITHRRTHRQTWMIALLPRLSYCGNERMSKFPRKASIERCLITASKEQQKYFDTWWEGNIGK